MSLHFSPAVYVSQQSPIPNLFAVTAAVAILAISCWVAETIPWSIWKPMSRQCLGVLHIFNGMVFYKVLTTKKAGAL